MSLHSHIKYYYRIFQVGKCHSAIHIWICIQFMNFILDVANFIFKKKETERKRGPNVCSVDPVCMSFAFFLCARALLLALVTFWLLVNLQFINNIDRKRVYVREHRRAHVHLFAVHTRKYTITLALYCSLFSSFFSFVVRVRYCDRFPMVSINIVTLASSRHSRLVHFTNIARNMQYVALKQSKCVCVCVFRTMLLDASNNKIRNTIKNICKPLQGWN